MLRPPAHPVRHGGPAVYSGEQPFTSLKNVGKLRTWTPPRAHSRGARGEELSKGDTCRLLCSRAARRASAACCELGVIGLTSTFPLPSSTILSWAATAGLACSSVTSNLSWKALAAEKGLEEAKPTVCCLTDHFWNSCVNMADSAPSLTVSTLVLLG
ncbi:hypothetical protein MC885_017242 [Smutsia gigantea]|nr:hypothetical protein MC885_017242 [Smutsia gigantea]